MGYSSKILVFAALALQFLSGSYVYTLLIFLSHPSNSSHSKSL